MQFRLSPPKSLLPLMLLATLLAGCGRPDANAFPPACPRAAILGDAADLVRYRDGGGRDLTDLTLAGRIVGVSGQCQPGDTPRELQATMQVTVELTRGPARQLREAEVSIFVAVSEGDRILDKKLFPLRAAFAPNIDKLRLTTEAIAMVLPVSPDKSGAAYALTAGFQLTPEELERNRTRPAP